MYYYGDFAKKILGWTGFPLTIRRHVAAHAFKQQAMEFVRDCAAPPIERRKTTTGFKVKLFRGLIFYFIGGGGGKGGRSNLCVCCCRCGQRSVLTTRDGGTVVKIAATYAVRLGTAYCVKQHTQFSYGYVRSNLHPLLPLCSTCTDTILPPGTSTFDSHY